MHRWHVKGGIKKKKKRESPGVRKIARSIRRLDKEKVENSCGGSLGDFLTEALYILSKISRFALPPVQVAATKVRRGLKFRRGATRKSLNGLYHTAYSRAFRRDTEGKGAGALALSCERAIQIDQNVLCVQSRSEITGISSVLSARTVSEILQIFFKQQITEIINVNLFVQSIHLFPF